MILVVNHISHADPFAVAHYVFDAGRWPSFLAKASLFERARCSATCAAATRSRCTAAPPTRSRRSRPRGSASGTAGPSSSTPRAPPPRNPTCGRCGARPARPGSRLDTGAPVIPIVMWGPEQIFDPRTQKLRLLPRAE